MLPSRLPLCSFSSPFLHPCSGCSLLPHLHVLLPIFVRAAPLRVVQLYASCLFLLLSSSISLRPTPSDRYALSSPYLLSPYLHNGLFRSPISSPISAPSFSSRSPSLLFFRVVLFTRCSESQMFTSSVLLLFFSSPLAYALRRPIFSHSLLPVFFRTVPLTCQLDVCILCASPPFPPRSLYALRRPIFSHSLLPVVFRPLRLLRCMLRSRLPA